jgi:hypothetical protein
LFGRHRNRCRWKKSKRGLKRARQRRMVFEWPEAVLSLRGDSSRISFSLGLNNTRLYRDTDKMILDSSVGEAKTS